MTWSISHVDSLPGGVRALPRSLRSAWVGAAESAVGRGLSTASARISGDAAVDLIKRGMADIGITPDAMEEWNLHNAIAHPLMQLLQEHDLTEAAGALHQLTLPGDGDLSEPGAFAAWLAEQLQALVGAGETEGEATEPDPDPADPGQAADNGAHLGVLAVNKEGEVFVVTQDSKQAPPKRGAPRLATAAALVAGLAGAPTQAHADAQTWRCDRIALDLTDEGRDAVDRALSRERRLAERGDSASFENVINQLRKDGWDDYVTPEGYLRVRVRAARSGVQLYSDGLTIWGELRPADEVFNPTTLASWGYKPFTNDHPPDFVGVHNWAQYAVGVVGDDASRAPGPDGDDYVEVTIVVYGFDALVAIKGGKVELSAGYTANMRRETGRDHKGREYAYRQTDIFINHLSLVDRGRAGPLARVNLDGFAWQVLALAADQVGTSIAQDHLEDSPMPTMIKVLISDGLEVEMTEADAARFHSHAKATADAAAAAKPQLDGFKLQLDAMEAKVGELVTAKAATDAELLTIKAENQRLKDAEQVRERAEVIDTIKAVSPKLDTKPLAGSSLTDLKAACVADLAPHYKPVIDEYRANGDAALAMFVDKLFVAEVARARKNPAVVQTADRVAPPTAPRTDLNSLRAASLGQSAAA